MAQSGYTPISLYYSATGAAVPLAADLIAGELALNTNDGKLYYKNSSNVVTLLAGATAGPAGGSTTQVQYNNGGVLAGITGATTNGTALTLVAPVLGIPASGTVTNLTGTASININGTVGATTPAALAATTGAFSDTITSTKTSGVFLNAASATTGLIYVNIANTNGTAVIGVENSTGSTWTGSTAYATLIGTSQNKPVQIGSNAAVVGSFSSTGLAVTGTLTATGSAAIGSTSFSNSKLYVTGTFGATAGITDAAIEVYVDDDGSTPKSGDRIGIKSILYNVGRTTGKTVGLYTDVSEIDTNICYGTYSKAAGVYLQQYAVYGEVSKNLAAYTAGYCFYGKATTTGSGGQVYFLAGDDNGTTRILAGQNGGLSNYQANDVNLSDRREKKDFAPAKSYLDVICAIPVQTFRYIDQKDDDLNLGVIAQDVQAVAPELVTESDWAAPDQEAKVRLAVYQTDLQFALMKAIQELAAKVAKLEAA